jgi:hypothetical protein
MTRKDEELLNPSSSTVRIVVRRGETLDDALRRYASQVAEQQKRNL